MGPMLAWVSNWCLAIYERRSRNHYWFGSLLTYYQQVLLMLLLAVMSSPWSERFPRCTRKMNVWMRAKGSIRNLPFLPTLFFFFFFRGSFGSFSDRSCYTSALSCGCDYWLENHLVFLACLYPVAECTHCLSGTEKCWDGSWINSWLR